MRSGPQNERSSAGPRSFFASFTLVNTTTIHGIQPRADRISTDPCPPLHVTIESPSKQRTNPSHFTLTLRGNRSSSSSHRTGAQLALGWLVRFGMMTKTDPQTPGLYSAVCARCAGTPPQNPRTPVSFPFYATPPFTWQPMPPPLRPLTETA